MGFVFNESSRCDDCEDRLRLYSTAQKIASLGYWILDIRTGELEWSGQIFKILEIADVSAIRNINSFIEYVHQDDKELVLRHFNSHLYDKKEYNIVHRIITGTGKVKYVQERCETESDTSGNPLKSFGIILDVTKMMTAEQRLEISLRDKERLIHELYHRTRNNMQLIMSMLNLYSDGLGDSGYKSFLRKTERRIHIMSLAQDKLMQTDDLSAVNLNSYFRDIIGCIMFYGGDGEIPIINGDFDDIYVSIDDAITCGLILGELLSCTIETCLCDEVDAVLFRDDAGDYELTVSGHRPLVVISEPSRTCDAYKLAVLLSESQLKGRIRIVEGDDKVLNVKFPSKEMPVRV